MQSHKMSRVVTPLLIALISTSFGMKTTTVTLSSARKVYVSGDGPPVVFSSGLFGQTPPWMYSRFLTDLAKNLTVVRVPGGVKLHDVAEVADKLAVDRVGFVAHSSFDAKILTSDRVERAVVCDPICIPGTGGVRVNVPTLAIEADLLYNSGKLPEFNRLQLYGPLLETHTTYDVGHTDILDNAVAELAKASGLWDSLRPTATKFSEWKSTPRRRSVWQLRSAYRTGLAELVSSYLLTKPSELRALPATSECVALDD